MVGENFAKLGLRLAKNSFKIFLKHFVNDRALIFFKKIQH